MEGGGGLAVEVLQVKDVEAGLLLPGGFMAQH